MGETRSSGPHRESEVWPALALDEWKETYATLHRWLHAGAFYGADLREFLLPYNEVRQADSPDELLLEFLESTYSAAADLGKWDRFALERVGNPRNA
jgi:hypothetical protein